MMKSSDMEKVETILNKIKYIHRAKCEIKGKSQNT